MRYPYTPASRIKFKNYDTTKCWQRWRVKRTNIASGNVKWCDFGRQFGNFLQNETHLAFNAANTLTGLCPADLKNSSYPTTCVYSDFKPTLVHPYS
jgi:hypothetical protein